MKKKIRVLQVVSVLNRGGIETLLMNLYKEKDNNRFQFDFLKLKSGVHDYDNEIITLGGKIYQVSDFDSRNIFLGLNKFFKEKHEDYDIVHSHVDTLSSIPLYYAKKYNIGVRIAHGHVTFEPFNWKFPIKMFFKQLIPLYANYLMACNKDVGKWLFKKRHFEVLNNGINTKLFRYDETKRAELLTSNNLSNQLVLGHIGRFRKVKNHIFLIDIFEAILRKKENSVLVLIGDGELKDSVEDYVKNKNLSGKVKFLGTIGNVNEYLNMFDMFLLPSIIEGTPLVLVEAQTSGLTCVISDRISKEVCITPLINIISLENSADFWAETILELSEVKHNRNNAYLEVIEKGFDIVHNTRWLENYYDLILKKAEE